MGGRASLWLPRVSGSVGRGKDVGSQRELSGSDTEGSATCNSSNCERRKFEDHWTGGIL